ncbi:glycosyltransferase family 4 protein [Raineya sp.]|jgi:glycosyltransferase involved in cell wall biosynthesis
MKVVFIFGGIPHYLEDFLNKLNETENLEVAVILPESKSSTIGSGVLEVKNNAKFKKIYAKEGLLLGQKSYIKNLSKIIKSEKPQIIVVGWPYILGLYFNWGLKWWIRKQGVKVFYRSIPYQLPKYEQALQFYAQQGFFDENMNHIKADSFAKKIKYWLITQINKLYFQWVDGHLNYCTKALDILPSYGVKKEKIFVTYNSIDTDKIWEAKEKVKNQPNILAPNPYRIIHVGRLIKWKKVDMLLKTFLKVLSNFPKAELIIIGDGPEKENLQKLTCELQIEKNVFFLGAIHNTEILGRYFSESLACVLVGAGGLVINEAMAWGKPVLCSEADGTEQDLVLNHSTGLFFQKDDLKDLQDKIEFMFHNIELTQQMGKNAENLIFSKINIHAVVQNFVNAFNAVTSNQYQLVYAPKNYPYSRSKT